MKWFLPLLLLATLAAGWAWGASPRIPASGTPVYTPLPSERLQPRDESPFLWADATDLTLEGRGFADTATPYRRLPTRAEALVPPTVYRLSGHTAGLAVLFLTDSPTVAAQWSGGGAMVHMPATGVSGLDLYRRTADGWAFAAVGRPNDGPTTATLVSGQPPEPTEYLLFLPLYQDVDFLSIGIDNGAFLAPAPVDTRKPLVFYGTSIVQGGCASRAGMAHPAILRRWLDRPVINLGFSGSGRMEPELAHLVAEIDAALYILDCLPNLTPDEARERIVPFVRIVRAARPHTPILLVEDPQRGGTLPDNDILRQAYQQLLDEGVEHLHLLPHDDLLAGPEEATVDGVHPTDLGFLRMASAHEPVLRRLLGDVDKQ